MKRKSISESTIQELLAEDSQGKFHAIDSGAVFPEGAPTVQGQCECCDRGMGEVAIMHGIGDSFGGEVLVKVCAECLADFIASTKVLPARISLVQQA